MGDRPLKALISLITGNSFLKFLSRYTWTLQSKQVMLDMIFQVLKQISLSTRATLTKIPPLAIQSFGAGITYFMSFLKRHVVLEDLIQQLLRISMPLHYSDGIIPGKE